MKKAKEREVETGEEERKEQAEVRLPERGTIEKAQAERQGEYK